jgi:hypothetical protein
VDQIGAELRRRALATGLTMLAFHSFP